ncbi:SDR family oxidoreductase [Deinococcus sp. QL22]|uniref:SDR family NAD(P)-dependent oxidoreductase n=1 Tax=Deinococcus sp. QL22 TaxID=2939437 RepID=UPI0020181D27|nr:SDR family NAD(P)-dependent oxidoreductase [Deinococcus sp. QL22]UQN06384.1 SDR family NAD(P)-dependent oxidoreductase [Deinococcus sp. QL22]
MGRVPGSPPALAPSCRHSEQLRQAVAGKTILITGASFGIGRAAALLLAEAGAEVLLLARSGDELAELATAIRANGGKASSYELDLSKPADLAPVAAQIRAAHPRIDIIISNAGKSIRRPVLQSGEKQDLDRLLAVNFSGPAALLLALVPRMVAQGGGQIVNVSSVSAGPPPLPRWGAYQSSKAGFDLWFKSLGTELRGRGVRVCSVYLPLVRTRMIAPTPAYRFAPALTPHEAAEAVAYALVYPKVQRVAPWWMKSLELAALLLPGPLGHLLSGLETLEFRLSRRQKR